MQLHSGHIAKLDQTLNILHCSRSFQAFDCLPHSFAANALSHSFGHRDFHFFSRLPLRWPFRTSGSSLYNLMCCRTYCTQDAAGLLRRCSWLFEGDLCRDVLAWHLARWLAAPFPRSRFSPCSDVRHWSLDVIYAEAEYTLSCPIYLNAFLSLFAL